MKKNRETAESSGQPGLAYTLSFLSRCSLKCLFRLSQLTGFILRFLPSRIKRIIHLNIKLCFAELSPPSQVRLINECLVHTACNFIELAYLWNKPVNQVLKKISQEKVTDNFFQDQGGRIIIAPHQGSWELLNLWLADQAEVFSLYKPARNHKLDQYILRKRNRNGARLLPTNTRGLRQLLKALKEKKTCMILPDQKPGDKMAQASAPFFGHMVRTQLLVKKLIEKSNCNVFIGAITRDLKSARYTLTIEQLERSQLMQDDSLSAAYLNLAIEKFISNDISQYQWSYRRFPYQTYTILDEGVT